jgi:hypothetical protein
MLPPVSGEEVSDQDIILVVSNLAQRLHMSASQSLADDLRRVVLDRHGYGVIFVDMRACVLQMYATAESVIRRGKGLGGTD